MGAKSVAVNLNQGSDTAHYSYRKLIIATGSRAMRVSSLGVRGDDLQNVFYIRQEAEAALLVKSLELLGEGSKAIIVGGGYIGLECAAALVGWGIETTLIMPGSTCMPRLFNKELGDWFEQQYVARGINIIKEDRVTEFMGDGSAVTGVQLKSGRTLACDIAIVGVGGLPNSEFCTNWQRTTVVLSWMQSCRLLTQMYSQSVMCVPSHLNTVGSRGASMWTTHVNLPQSLSRLQWAYRQTLTGISPTSTRASSSIRMPPSSSISSDRRTVNAGRAPGERIRSARSG